VVEERGSEPLKIPTLDLVVILCYLTGITSVGLLVTRRQKQTSEGYFLAGRSLGWPVVGAALFASNISTIHLVGLAASGYNEGLVWGNFEWIGAFTLILLALVFAPFYFRSRVTTLPEFLEKRYNSAARSFLAFMAITTALFLHIGISIYAGAQVFEQFFGISVLASILLISIATGIYTVLGGLKAVVVTETIQTFVLLAGAVAVTIYAIMALPAAGIHSLADLQAAAKPQQLSMLHSGDESALPWYAIFLGIPVLGIWYWCTDQTIVQRVLGAKTQQDAQLGALFAGFLKILPAFIVVFPGVLAYVLFRDRIGADANQALPVLITELVPTGMRGLIAAGLLAALMSTIASALNSSATLFSVDIVKRFRPRTSDAALVRIGRITAVVVMLLAMLWSTQGGRFSSIFEAAQAIASNLAPPITVVFLWGVFWRRGTATAAVSTLVFGFLMGATIFLVDLPAFGNTKLVTDGLGVPFLMQAWWGFVICSVVYFAVSLSTQAPAAKQIDGLTWERPLAILTEGRISGPGDPRIVACTLLVVMGLLFYLFR
jgi:solute:Na+ symporter, SSS family